MPMVGELELPSLRYEDLSTFGAPFHELMHGLRRHSWLADVEGLGYVVLERSAVELVLRTRHARMPAVEIIELQGVTSGPIHDQLSGNLINLHGEDHRRLRSLVHPAFTPQAAQVLRPSMQRHLETLFGAVQDEGRCELVHALAAPYPALMIAEIVGAPQGDAERLGEWAYWIQSTFDPTKLSEQAPRIAQAAAEFEVYVRGLLDTAADDGGAGLIALFRGAIDDGRVTEAEAVSTLSSVLIGGVDTTRAQLAHTVRLLAEHPDQWAALREDPGLVPAAVEESLRFEPIAPFTARLVTSDLEHRDVVFPAGTVLFACALTANHDPDVLAEPHRFDITADRGDVKPLTFGAGPHFCLGASLARAELEEALAFLAERIVDLSLAGPPVYDTPPGVYGLLELPIAFTTA